MRTIIEQNMLLYAMAATGMLGILSQILLNRCYRLLIREASDIQAEKKEFMKKLKQKYRTDRKRSGENMNVQVFLQRNLMDYRYKRLSLHQWRRTGAGLFLLSLAAGAAGILYCNRAGIAQIHIQNIVRMAAGVTAATAAVSLWLDIRYKASYLQTQLEDYFYHSGAGTEYREVELAEPEKEKRKTPSIIGIHRKKEAEPAETRAQKEKRELQENLARMNVGARESAADTERTKERNREILRQMDSSEQERIIRDVLAEFLA